MDKKRKRQFTIRIFCVLASFMLWLYIYNFVNPIKNIKLSNVSVELKNTEALSQFKLVMLPGDQHTLTLSLSGNVDNLQNISKDKFKLVADLSGFGFKKGDVNRIPVTITEKPDNVQVTNSEMLYINIKTDDYVEKTFSLKSDIKGKVKTGYIPFSTTFKPTEVVVSGAARYVNAVATVEGSIDITGASSDMAKNVNIKALDESRRVVNEVTISPSSASAVTLVRKIKTVGINVKTKGNIGKDYILKSITPVQDKIEVAIDENSSYNNITSLDTAPLTLDPLTTSSDQQLSLVVPDGVKLVTNNGSITVKVVVSKIIQKNVSVDIKIKNLADTLNATLEKTKASLVLSGEESVINAFKDGDADCYVDLNSLAEGADFTVPVVVKLPAGITKVSQAPQNIKVAIAKK